MFLLLRKSLIKKMFNWLENEEKYWLDTPTKESPKVMLSRWGQQQTSIHSFAQGHFSRAHVCCRETQAPTFKLKDTLFNHFSSSVSSDNACSIIQSSSWATNNLRAHAIHYLAQAFILAFWFSQIKTWRANSLSCIQGHNTYTKLNRNPDNLHVRRYGAHWEPNSLKRFIFRLIRMDLTLSF